MNIGIALILKFLFWKHDNSVAVVLSRAQVCYFVFVLLLFILYFLSGWLARRVSAPPEGPGPDEHPPRRHAGD